MDLTTILVALGLLTGLLGADAALNANTVGVRFFVPQPVEETGISREVAEQIFTNEILKINRTPSLLAPPQVRSTSDPSVLGVIANTLKLQDITYALQSALGLSPLRLNGAVILVRGDQRLVITGSSPDFGPFTVDVREGADITDLLKRAAFGSIEQVQPYRAALHRFVQTVEAGGADYAAVSRIAERELARPARPQSRDQRAFLQNLLGIVALMNRDIPEAENRFTQALAIRPDLDVGRLNLAFVRTQQDRYEDALALLRPVVELRLSPPQPPVLAAAQITWAATAWAMGDIAEGERRFGEALRADGGGAAVAYEHWATLLEEAGRPEAAAEKRALARAHPPTFENYPEVALLYFQLSARDNQPLRRR